MIVVQVFDAVTIAFTGGGAVGWLLRHAFDDARHLHEKNLLIERHAADQKEIGRLRAFMAQHVGT